MGIIKDTQKSFFRDKAIEAARKYERYFNGKKFLIITEDWNAMTISFRSRDFIHMTGLVVNLTDASFYTNCVKGTLSASNLCTLQSHNVNTLKQKVKSLEKIHCFIHEDAGTNLFLIDLQTKNINHPFPAAIRNDQKNVTMAFYKKQLYGRSLRKSTSSLNAKEAKLIKSIFELDGNGIGFNLIYIKDALELIQNFSDLQKLINAKTFERIQASSEKKMEKYSQD